METDRIRVDHIPGGVWKRAPLITPDGHKASACHTGSPDCAWVSVDNTYEVTREIGPDWHVCLSDPLGLGLAGLAARVGQRLDFACPPDQDLCFAIVEWWWNRHPQLWDARPGLRVAIIAVAIYLALTDRLCAAVGLEREGHEVARWGCIGDENWRLVLPSGPHHDFKCTWDLRKPDGFTKAPALANVDRFAEGAWLKALEAALEAQNGQR